MLRIIKVGGSLLDWPPLPQALRSWLAAEPLKPTVLICGCGKLADIIRQADRDFSLGEEPSNLLCVDLLSVTARLLATILPDLSYCGSYAELNSSLSKETCATIIFDPRQFLTAHEPSLPGRPLPHTWSVTTDSIAARLAQAIGAEELVLLKSQDAPPLASLTDLSVAGLVDPHFPLAAAAIPTVRLINLRCFPSSSSPTLQP